MELLRQGQQGLGENGHRIGLNRDFPSLGAEHLALHAHNVANVQGGLHGPVGLLAHYINLGVKLDASGAVPQVQKGDLAHAPAAHNTPGQTDRFALQGVKMVRHILGLILHGEPGVAVGVLAVFLHVCQLLPADFQDFPHILRRVRPGLLVLMFCHSFFNSSCFS